MEILFTLFMLSTYFVILFCMNDHRDLTLFPAPLNDSCAHYSRTGIV
ncbi:hypothetical protein B0G76_4888 [Paraburkholderia sp. BL23I1N1]|nr:hypothetical protein B0G76_4888 [Paraburkholderia sp. BL23I1N1]